MTKKEIKKREERNFKKTLQETILQRKVHTSFIWTKKEKHEREIISQENNEDDYIMEPESQFRRTKELNVENEYLGFNRGLDWEVWKGNDWRIQEMGQWVDSDTNTVILQPRMYHQHARKRNRPHEMFDLH